MWFREYGALWFNGGYTFVAHIGIVAAILDQLEMTRAIAGAMLALSVAAVSSSGADEFIPLCADLETARKGCWTPVEVAGHQGCHFHGALSLYYHEPPLTWSGDCRDGKAEGDGVLEDDLGNRSEGHLVVGKKDGEWTTRHANGGIVTEVHVEGTAHGLWTFDFSAHGGRSYVVHYKDGLWHGRWERRDPGGYSEIGSFEDDKRNGTWTITWPNGVEALVPYENDVIHGEMTVTRDGRPLGTLVYWKGRHVDGILRPELHFPDDP